MKRYFLRSVSVCLGLLVAALLLELLLRVTDGDNYDKLFVDRVSGLMTYRPGIDFYHSATCYRNLVRVNNLGFHGPAVETAKGKGVFRILVVGGSFVEARPVPVPAMFTSALEQRLNADPHRIRTYEVIPIAFSGNGTFLDFLYYLRFASPLSPDLVITLETEYELDRNAPGSFYSPRFDSRGTLMTDFPPVAPAARFAYLKSLARQLKLVMNLNNRGVLFRAGLADFFRHPAFFGPGEQASDPTPSASSLREGASLWQVEEKVLDAYASRVHADHAGFLLALWRTPRVAPERAREIEERFPAIAHRHGFSYLDLTPQIAEKAREEGERPDFACDAHWSFAGNRYAADSLAAYLNEHSELLHPR